MCVLYIYAVLPRPTAAATPARDRRGDEHARSVDAVRFCRSNRFLRIRLAHIICDYFSSCYVSRTRRRRGDRGHVGHLCRSVHISHY